MRSGPSHGRSTLIAITALAVVMTSACLREKNTNPGLAAVARDYPAVDGSTSTHPLGVLLACKALGVPYEWRTPPASERTVFPARDTHPLSAAQIEREIQHHGTHQAYMNLINREADLILVARAPSMGEQNAARDAGIVLDVRPIALDALVFVVNTANPVDDLSLHQIRAIFGGKGPRNWAEVGGSDTPLEPYQRQQDSGSQELMRALVMHDLAMIDASLAPLIFTMGGVVDTMAVRKHGISFSVYYYVTNMAPNPAAKMVAVDGIAPAADTIASRQYPLTTEVYAALRQETPQDSSAFALADWLLTREGRAAIRESGYVPIE